MNKSLVIYCFDFMPQFPDKNLHILKLFRFFLQIIFNDPDEME